MSLLLLRRPFSLVFSVSNLQLHNELHEISGLNIVEVSVILTEYGSKCFILFYTSYIQKVSTVTLFRYTSFVLNAYTFVNFLHFLPASQYNYFRSPRLSYTVKKTFLGSEPFMRYFLHLVIICKSATCQTSLKGPDT
jgi:hypothetical protein